MKSCTGDDESKRCASNVDDLRAAFESWVEGRYKCSVYSMMRNVEGYPHTIGHHYLPSTYASVQMLWEAWQAAAALGKEKP